MTNVYATSHSENIEDISCVGVLARCDGSVAMMGCCCDGEKQRDAYGKGDGDGKMPRPNSVDSTRETLNRRRHPNLMEIEMVLHGPPLQQMPLRFSRR